MTSKATPINSDKKPDSYHIHIYAPVYTGLSLIIFYWHC
jgi:hypothetical protein